MKKDFKNICTGQKTVVFLIIGLILTFVSIKESKTTLLVETGSSTIGINRSLQQFVGLSSINLKGARPKTNSLFSFFYTYIIKSNPFLWGVIELRRNSTLTVSQFPERHSCSSLLSNIISYTIGVHSKIFGAIRSKNYFHIATWNLNHYQLSLSLIQSVPINFFTESIKTKQGELNNNLVKSAENHDPLFSPQLTDSVVKSLSKRNTEYFTQEAKIMIRFVASVNAEADVNYKQVNHTLSSYADQNKNVILALTKDTDQRLPSDFRFAIIIYNIFFQQVELTQLKVQENKPLLTVLNPAELLLLKVNKKEFNFGGRLSFLGVELLV